MKQSTIGLILIALVICLSQSFAEDDDDYPDPATTCYIEDSRNCCDLMLPPNGNWGNPLQCDGGEPGEEDDWRCTPKRVVQGNWVFIEVVTTGGVTDWAYTGTATHCIYRPVEMCGSVVGECIYSDDLMDSD